MNSLGISNDSILTLRLGRTDEGKLRFSYYDKNNKDAGIEIIEEKIVNDKNKDFNSKSATGNSSNFPHLFPPDFWEDIVKLIYLRALYEKKNEGLNHETATENIINNEKNKQNINFNSKPAVNKDLDYKPTTGNSFNNEKNKQNTSKNLRIQASVADIKKFWESNWSKNSQGIGIYPYTGKIANEPINKTIYISGLGDLSYLEIECSSDKCTLSLTATDRPMLLLTLKQDGENFYFYRPSGEKTNIKVKIVEDIQESSKVENHQSSKLENHQKLMPRQEEIGGAQNWSK